MSNTGSDFGPLGSEETMAVMRHLHIQDKFGYKPAKKEQTCPECGHKFEPY